MHGPGKESWGIGSAIGVSAPAPEARVSLARWRAGMGSATRWRRWTRRLPGRAGAGVAHPSPRGGVRIHGRSRRLCQCRTNPGPLRARSPRGTAAAGPGHDHRSASTPLPARRHRPRRLLARIPPRRHPCHQARRMGLAPGAWRALALQGRHVAARAGTSGLAGSGRPLRHVPHPTAATTANTAAERHARKRRAPLRRQPTPRHRRWPGQAAAAAGRVRSRIVPDRMVGPVPR